DRIQQELLERRVRQPHRRRGLVALRVGLVNGEYPRPARRIDVEAQQLRPLKEWQDAPNEAAEPWKLRRPLLPVLLVPDHVRKPKKFEGAVDLDLGADLPPQQLLGLLDPLARQRCDRGWCETEPIRVVFLPEARAVVPRVKLDDGLDVSLDPGAFELLP